MLEINLLEVKWLNSQIFYELCGCKGIGTSVENHGCKSWRERQRKEPLTILGAKSTHYVKGDQCMFSNYLYTKKVIFGQCPHFLETRPNFA